MKNLEMAQSRVTVAWIFDLLTSRGIENGLNFLGQHYEVTPAAFITLKFISFPTVLLLTYFAALNGLVLYEHPDGLRTLEEQSLLLWHFKECWPKTSPTGHHVR